MPTWLQSLQARDVDDHCANLGHWELNYDQISSGAFQGTFTELRLPDMQLFRETTSQRVRQHGHLGLDSFGIGLPWNTKADIRFNGGVMNDGDIITSFDSDVDFCTPAGFEFRGMVVDSNLMRRTMALMNLQLCDDVWHQMRAMTVSQQSVARLRQLLEFAQSAVDETPWVLDDEAARQHLADSIMAGIVDMLPAAEACGDIRAAIAKKRVVDHALDLVLSQPDRPVSILELCKRVGASQRKLNYCFLEVIGTSPIKYLRAIRLNRVRRELKQCTDERSGIYDIAVRWGFWHFSQFSHDYRKQFDELPSDTLKRARGHCARGSEHSAPPPARRQRMLHCRDQE